MHVGRQSFSRVETQICKQNGQAFAAWRMACTCFCWRASLYAKTAISLPKVVGEAVCPCVLDSIGTSANDSASPVIASTACAGTASCWCPKVDCTCLLGRKDGITDRLNTSVSV